MTTRGVRFCQCVALGALLLPVTASAEGWIPWPWKSSAKYRTWKQERDDQRASYYTERAEDPVGARQYEYKGKEWPPYQRPTGPAQVPTHIYHAAHYWPHPYVCQDRQSVREFVHIQEEAGWVSETTLYDYHFDRDQQALNRAGLIHLRWILENAPESRRTVFVQSGANNGASQLRMANVQSELSEIVPSGAMPPVALRVTQPLGRPAMEVDKIQRSEIDSQPVPRISPPFANGGLGSTGSTQGNSGL